MNSRINLKSIFQALPASYLVLKPDLTILAATDKYYNLTMSSPEDLIGKYIFDAFPENKKTAKMHGIQRHKESFEHVLRHKTPHTIPVQRYDIKLPPNEGGKYVARWWRITNSPILSASGKLQCIIHAIDDITEMVAILEEAEEAAKHK